MKKTTTTFLILATALTGCATRPQTGVNSPEHEAALISQFNKTCESLGGIVGKAVAKGSLGLCTRNGKAADFYMHRDFVMLNSERPGDSYSMSQYYLMMNCGKDKGDYESGDRMVGINLQGPVDGKVSCKAAEWYVTVSAPLISDGKRKTMVNASVRRTPSGQPSEGVVPSEYFSLALRYTTS